MSKLTHTQIKDLLLNCINSIPANKEDFFTDPDKNFSRTQKISFLQTMLFPMTMGKENNSCELLDFFPESSIPTQAAMSYRRDQIKVSAFVNLFSSFTDKLPKYKKYQGLRLVACDGTRVNLPYNPKDTETYTCSIKNRKGFNQLLLNCLYDILNGYFLDCISQGYHFMNEKNAFCTMMDRFPKDVPVLFIADRGYSSFNVIAHAFHNKQYFLIRLTSTMAKNLLKDDIETEKHKTIDLESYVNVGIKYAKKYSSLHNYHRIANPASYDFIEAGSDKVEKIPVRLVKFPLSDDTYEYIVTNLPASEFPMSKIKELYQIRWGIETSFKYLKYAESLNYVHSLKRNFVQQEIFAKLTVYNFCSAIYNITNSKSEHKTKKRKHEYKTDQSYLIKVCIRFLKGKLEEILELIEKKKVPIRPGRTSKRNLIRQSNRPLQNR